MLRATFTSTLCYRRRTLTGPQRAAKLARPLLLSSILLLNGQAGQCLATENVVLVTLDGFRWQELFRGADESLMTYQRYVGNPADIKEQLWAEDPTIRRKMLLPFLWGTVARNGQLYGNRARGNQVNLRNRIRKSYSGYNEILSGRADDERIKGNRRIYNPNITVLEYANRQPGLAGRVACFASWELFPWIVNDRRSGIPVNAGSREATEQPLSNRETFLNILQRQTASPWRGVRLDVFTQQYALEYLAKRQPRLVFIGLGETDEYAHAGQYDNYLFAAQRADAMLRELWQWLQADPHYRGRTTLLVTTDHGRGTGRQWTDHGKRIEGSDQAWLAAIGPDTRAIGEVRSTGTVELNQLAATVAALLGFEFLAERPAGTAIENILK